MAPHTHRRAPLASKVTALRENGFSRTSWQASAGKTLQWPLHHFAIIWLLRAKSCEQMTVLRHPRGVLGLQFTLCMGVSTTRLEPSIHQPMIHRRSIRSYISMTQRRPRCSEARVLLIEILKHCAYCMTCWWRRCPILICGQVWLLCHSRQSHGILTQTTFSTCTKK